MANVTADEKRTDHRQYHYTVDDRPFKTEQQFLTGAAIKASAAVDPTFGLFREGQGHGSNQQIGDSQEVDLSQPENNKFFTAPPATFGRALLV